jgi:hypothetical protein
VEALAAAKLHPLGDVFVEPGAPTAITLAPVDVYFPDGNGLRLSAVRVPIHAVAAWWVLDGTMLKAKTEGFWIAGVTFPVDFG